MRLNWILRGVAAGAFGAVMMLPLAPAKAAYNYDGNITAVYGSGNPSDHWTVSSENPGGGTIVTGLRAVNRFGASIAPAPGTGNYLVEAGPYPGAPSLALWNFTFSISTIDSTLNLSQLNAWLTVTPASTGVASTPFDLLAITDNASGTNPGELAQNSENLGFGGGGFNPSAIDTYTLTLNLVPKTGGSPVVTNTINVTTFNASPVPEPASMALLGAGLFGLGLFRRRRA